MHSINPITCLVLGSGTVPLGSVPPADMCITFNRAMPPRPVKWHLDVTSRRALGGSIEITGEGPEDLVEKLRHGVHSGVRINELALECWPSSGFSILHALWDLDIAVQARGISFDPPLRRDGHLSPRSAPPVMYHNWLGERRLSFARWITAPPRKWHWPMMRPRIAPYPHSSHALPSMDLLAGLSRACQTRQLDDLVNLLAVPLLADPKYISSEASHISALEQCFHLARGVSETPNWWLYDVYGADIIDKLAQRIRACQAALFAVALMRATAPAG